MVKVKRTRALPFPVGYYPRVGSHSDEYVNCVRNCITRWGVDEVPREICIGRCPPKPPDLGASPRQNPSRLIVDLS